MYLGVVHRLDRPVSGVVLFAKTSKALTRLNEMFRTQEIKPIGYRKREARATRRSSGALPNAQ